MDNVQILKNIAIRESVHAQIVSCAKDRGMTIQGLTERIIRGWLDENFFNHKVASGNKGTRSRAEARP